MKFQILNYKFQISLDCLTIAGILILASFLRLYRIADYITFLGDEGRDVLVVYNILHGNLTLLGPTASVGGFFLGPIYYYFMTPFLWLFNYNPVGPAVMVALFGIATVWLVYKVGSDFFNVKTGLIASILYAVSPIIVTYSRSSWNPNLMPFFSLLTIYVLFQAVKKTSAKLFIASGVLFGILMQLHYLATFLGAAIVIYIIFLEIIAKNRLFVKIIKIFKNYFYLFIGFIIGWSPFLLFEVRHGFPNTQSIFSFIFHSNDTGGGVNFFGIVSDVFFRLFARLVFKFPPSEQLYMYSKLHISFWSISITILALISIGIVLFQLRSFLKEKKEEVQKASLLLIWLISGLLFFGFYKKSIYDYYFGFMFPLPFIFIGNLFSTFLNNSLTKPLSIMVFAFLVVFNFSHNSFKYEPNRQLLQAETISRFVFDKTDKKPFNFALITGGNSDHAYRYFFTIWNKPPMVIQNPVIDPERKSVADQLFVVCESNPCEPIGHSLWEIAGFGRAEIAGEWNVSVVKVYKLVHYKGG
ncbi:MAG: glycosyltransferase family 39 protein [Candidatus Levyibacteriota bacterium]